MRENTKEKSAGIAKAVIYLLTVLVIAGTAVFFDYVFYKGERAGNYEFIYQ